MIHNPNDRICIQLGLGRSAEYIYLASPRWQELIPKQKTLKRIPEALCTTNNNRRWHYYGIDASLASILFCAARYSLLPHEQKKYLSWICTAITDSQDFYTSDYFGFKNSLPPRNPKISSDGQLFPLIFRAPFDWIAQKLEIKDQKTLPLILGAPFDWILRRLEINEIDVLVTDIEGFENTLFANYSWEIHPKFIAVEFHDELNCVNGIPVGIDFAARERTMGKKLAELIQARGYKLVCREPTNYKGKNYSKTMELQFLREDLCD